MNIFSTLFGTEALSIKETCVLTPFLNKNILDGFRITKQKRGAVYSVGTNGLFSLIHTGIGSTFVGDAVLYLENTPCKNLILFGSCGAVKRTKKLGVGDIVTVKKALCQDSFVDMLLERKTRDIFYPDRNFLAKISSNKLPEVTCLTVGSLKLEEEYLERLRYGSIDIVDMETAAFFAAAEFVRKKAVAILFVTDILKSFPYYNVLKRENRALLKSLTRKASSVVYELIKNSRICEQ